jgi:hypothetical protein
MKAILETADHPQVVCCWNSNPGEVVNGSIAPALAQVAHKLGQTMHIHDLYDKQYPYLELFGLLKKQQYDGWMLSESPPTADPVRVMKYYRMLFDELVARA